MCALICHAMDRIAESVTTSDEPDKNLNFIIWKSFVEVRMQSSKENVENDPQ